MKKRVFICTPLKGEFDKNVERAKRYSRFAVLKGFLPITPHIYFIHFLDDDSIDERETGMALGRELLEDCEEIWTFGHEVSEGMKLDLELAKSLNIPAVEMLEEFLEWERETGW